MTVSIEPLPNIFRLDQAFASGMSKRQLYALRDAGELVSAGHGIFARSDTPDDALMLAAISLRRPEATICLTSALVHHGLADDIQRTIDIALPRGMRRPAGFPHVTWHSFERESFNVGREFTFAGGIRTGIYSASRTIVDVFRLRHQEGSDVAYEALRRWLRMRDSQPSNLLMIAASFPKAELAIRHALEILL